MEGHDVLRQVNLGNNISGWLNGAVIVFHSKPSYIL